MYFCQEDSKNPLFSLPRLFCSSFKLQIRPVLSGACPDAGPSRTFSSMPLLRAACNVFPPRGSFAGVCLIPDFPYLSTTSVRAGILFFFFFNLIWFMYLSLAGLGLHRCMSFSLVAVSGGSSLWCPGFSCCGAEALGLTGFSSCGSWALEHRFNSCGTQV